MSTLDLWTSYIDGTSIYNDVNGDPVVTEKAHYLIGGSDTHDVLYPGFADENYKNTKRSSTDYVSGKIRTYAYVGETTESIMENGLAYGEAVVSGHSYTTYGPLLDMDKLPGDGGIHHQRHFLFEHGNQIFGQYQRYPCFNERR